jgi:outer membrane protein assembly factor BamB
MVVVVGVDGFVVALSASDGSERWRTYIGGESLATPLVHEQNVIIGALVDCPVDADVDDAWFDVTGAGRTGSDHRLR